MRLKRAALLLITMGRITMPIPALADSINGKCSPGTCSNAASLLDQYATLPRPTIALYVSFSLPLESWKAFSPDLESLGGAFVVQGLPKGSIYEFQKKIQELRNAGVLAPILLDPEAFSRLGINRVPLLVVERNENGKHITDKVLGNVPIMDSIRLMLNEGDNKAYVRELLEKKLRSSHRGQS